MVFLLFTNDLPMAYRRTLLQPMSTSVTGCELHLTIFHMCVQYVCVIRNAHVEYTGQDSLDKTKKKKKICVFQVSGCKKLGMVGRNNIKFSQNIIFSR